jgi:beta-alanine--pyruvate transaminase
MPEYRPNDLSAYWMPFTANRQFKAKPRMLVSAKGMYYTSDDGRQILDGFSGMWCVNAGHCRDKIVKAVQAGVAKLDYSPAFQMGYPDAFELATKLVQLMPGDLNHVFYTNSGSEAVDTALKLALAYHQAKGESSRTRLIGRVRGYHGVNFGGMSVGGIGNNRKAFNGAMVAGVDHLPHTHDLEHNAFTRGLPQWGAHLADELERLVALHHQSTIAAVIVEPMAGSTGVLLPPKGYLERLRAICDKYGILLIFDEVITGFGRLGAPFAVNYFGIQPDIVTGAKGVTNGTVPMGVVYCTDKIHDALMTGPESAVEFFHGYTYSAHPVAVAAALGTLEVYAEEGLLTRGASLASYWEDALFSLKGLPNIIDIRALGLVAGVELASRPGAVGARAYEAFVKCFEAGLLIRVTGDIIALAPPLIVEKSQIDAMIGTLGDILKTIA